MILEVHSSQWGVVTAAGGGLGGQLQHPLVPTRGIRPPALLKMGVLVVEREIIQIVVLVESGTCSFSISADLKGNPGGGPAATSPTGPTSPGAGGWWRMDTDGAAANIYNPNHQVQMEGRGTLWIHGANFPSPPSSPQPQYGDFRPGPGSNNRHQSQQQDGIFVVVEVVEVLMLILVQE